MFRPGSVSPDSVVMPAQEPVQEQPAPVADTPSLSELTPEAIQETDPLAGILGETEAQETPGEEESETTVVVESPLYRFTFSELGARLVAASRLHST